MPRTPAPIMVGSVASGSLESGCEDIRASTDSPRPLALLEDFRASFKELGHSLSRVMSFRDGQKSLQKSHSVGHGLSERLGRLETHVFRGISENAGDCVEDFYELGEQIGNGAFGACFKAVDKATGVSFCCKTIPRSSLTHEMFADIKMEAEILCHLRGHQNIVELMGMFEDEINIYIVQELCTGGDLFNKLSKNTIPLSERDAAAMVHAILSVIEHCHSMGVLYRDVKPENFMLSHDGKDATIKATDFGISKFMKRTEVTTDFCGTPATMAPEVFELEYGFPSDVWSAGVCMYWILSGEYPFKGRSQLELARKVAFEPVSMEGAGWQEVSSEAKDLIRLLLTKDHKKRPTAAEMLQHKWFKTTGSKTKPLGNMTLERMRAFSRMHPFKKQVMRYIASTLDESYLVGLRVMFAAMDVSKTGELCLTDIMTVLEEQCFKAEPKEVQSLLEAMDEDGNGCIDFYDFAAATLNSSLLERKDLLESAYDHFDLCKDGFISLEEWAVNMRKQKHMTNKEIGKLIAQLDHKADGKLDYPEFCSLMLGIEEVELGFFEALLRVPKPFAAPEPGSLFSKVQKAGSGPVPNIFSSYTARKSQSNYRSYGSGAFMHIRGAGRVVRKSTSGSRGSSGPSQSMAGGSTLFTPSATVGPDRHRSPGSADHPRLLFTATVTDGSVNERLRHKSLLGLTSSPATSFSPSSTAGPKDAASPSNRSQARTYNNCEGMESSGLSFLARAFSPFSRTDVQSTYQTIFQSDRPDSPGFTVLSNQHDQQHGISTINGISTMHGISTMDSSQSVESAIACPSSRVSNSTRRVSYAPDLVQVSPSQASTASCGMYYGAICTQGSVDGMSGIAQSPSALGPSTGCSSDDIVHGSSPGSYQCPSVFLTSDRISATGSSSSSTQSQLAFSTSGIGNSSLRASDRHQPGWMLEAIQEAKGALEAASIEAGATPRRDPVAVYGVPDAKSMPSISSLVNLPDESQTPSPSAGSPSGRIGLYPSTPHLDSSPRADSSMHGQDTFARFATPRVSQGSSRCQNNSLSHCPSEGASIDALPAQSESTQSSSKFSVSRLKQGFCFVASRTNSLEAPQPQVQSTETGGSAHGSVNLAATSSCASPSKARRLSKNGSVEKEQGCSVM